MLPYADVRSLIVRCWFTGMLELRKRALILQLPPHQAEGNKAATTTQQQIKPQQYSAAPPGGPPGIYVCVALQ
jgi:hypothetical protein